MSKKPTYKELEKLTQELKRREVYYRLISENSTDMISKHDSNGIYTYASSSCQDLIGYTSDELIGRSAYVIFHYDDLKKMKNSHQEIFLTNIAHTVSYQIKHKQGHYIYVETTSKAIRNHKSGNIEEIIAITRGITDRKRTEKVLREQTITLTDILERAGDGICVCHNITDWPHVRFTVWNPRMVEITGYTMQEINQLGWYQTMYPDPDIQQRVINRMERMRVGEDILAEEWCITTKDNHQKILSISTTALTIENGKIHVLAVMQDITERKKAEDELRKSEFKYRDIFENVSDFLYFHDLKGYFVETNFASKEITGYNEGDLTKMKIMDLIPERYKHLFDEYLEEVITKGKSEGLLTVLAKNGNEHVLEYKNSLIFDSTGPIGVRGIARDVTERRQAEKKILQAKQEWEKTFNAVPDLIAILDNNYRIIRVNKAMADRLGMLPDCAVGLNCYKYIHGTNEPPLYCPHTKLLADGKEHSVEVNEKRLNGDFWVTDSPLYDSAGHLIGSVHVARDITESKKDKELLRKSEEKYRNLIEKLDDIIWVADLNLCTTYVSTSIEKQLGFTPEERLAQEFKEQVTPSSYQRVLEILAHELERDQDENSDPNRIARIEVEYYHKNGSTKWLETIASGVRDKKGSLVGVHGLSRNITDRKYAEMEKEQLEAQLRQSQKMESIGTLAGGIAHNFNNIFQVIIGNTELALDDLPKHNPAIYSIENIKTTSLRAAEIVKQLLAFSKKIDIELKEIDVTAVIRDAIKFIRSMIPATIKIRENFPVKNITIFADPVQIIQILINICTNASQAMEETGGIIETTIEMTIIEKGAIKNYPDLAPGKYVKIAIRDTGPGIAPENIDRIFDPFFTTRGVGKGSGMGLAVVHGIVKNHKAAITVDSEQGKYTTFNLFFPVIDEKSEVKVTNEIPCGNETILFVDDDKDISDMTQNMLRRLGYQVAAKLDPLEAFDLFQSQPHKFDLVITDMTMPSMTGTKLSDKIKNVRPDIPIIICTGYSSLVNEERAKEHGIDAYVMKPIVMKDIAKTIRKVLDAQKNST